MGCGDLVVRSRLRVQRAPVSKPDSTEDSSCMGPVAHKIIRSGQTSSCWSGAEPDEEYDARDRNPTPRFREAPERGGSTHKVGFSKHQSRKDGASLAEQGFESGTLRISSRYITTKLPRS
ncbi:hypothetical protein AVEN_159398-1 [Araneus ventricosus]|uniref:Uncharacterized protein n=1 Tax=Araneus ventricosus TaxID=182803 RepID=A0A4Y2A0R0_ARAVE|nr:hypothetical protein AVEN_159398-1 [Araneus ventricosus]